MSMFMEWNLSQGCSHLVKDLSSICDVFIHYDMCDMVTYMILLPFFIEILDKKHVSTILE